MKSIFLCIALLLSAPVVMAESVINDHSEQPVCTEEQHSSDRVTFDSVSAAEVQEMDEFDALMDSDVRLDDIEEPKQVSACEAFAKQIGFSVLMKCIALKIWLEHQWKALVA